MHDPDTGENQRHADNFKDADGFMQHHRRERDSSNRGEIPQHRGARRPDGLHAEQPSLLGDSSCEHHQVGQGKPVCELDGRDASRHHLLIGPQ